MKKFYFQPPFDESSQRSLDNGELKFLLNPSYYACNIPKAVEIIQRRWRGWHTRYISSLCQVYSPVFGISRGCILPLDTRVIPIGCRLVVTFNLNNSYNTSDKITNIRRITRYSYVWNKGLGEYITVGLSFQECAELGMDKYQFMDIRYFYKVLGLAFHTVFKPKVLPTFEPFLYKDQYFHTSLASAMKTPFQAWGYGRKIWEYGPNTVVMTPETALYFSMFGNNPATAQNRLLLGLDGSVGVTQILEEAIIKYSSYGEESYYYYLLAFYVKWLTEGSRPELSRLGWRTELGLVLSRQTPIIPKLSGSPLKIAQDFVRHDSELASELKYLQSN